MIPLRDCQTAGEVLENFREVRARMRATIAAAQVRLAPPPPPPEPEPEPQAPVEPAPPPKPPPAVPSRVMTKPQRVMRLVSQHLQISPDDMCSIDRTAPVVLARSTAMYLLRKLSPQQSLPWIGKIFGRDHTTVLHALESMQEKVVTDPEYAALVAMMLNQLQRRREGK